MWRIRSNGIAVLAAMAAIFLSGCEVDTHKNGNSEDVKIETPIGGMHVKTNDAVVLADIGLPAYPGAQLVKEDKDSGSADVNMSFGKFQLRVKAAGFRTTDSPEKVEAFYRNGLKRFGDVIECRDGHPVGTPAKTAEGLSCDHHEPGNVHIGDDSNKSKLELKAGSQQHEHLVEIDPEGSGTKFGLVALDLPAEFFTGDDDDGE